MFLLKILKLFIICEVFIDYLFKYRSLLKNLRIFFVNFGDRWFLEGDSNRFIKFVDNKIIVKYCIYIIYLRMIYILDDL